MNTELTHSWTNKDLFVFSFRRRHLVCASYECHMEDSVKSSLQRKLMFRLFPAGVRNTSKLQTLVRTSFLRQKQQKSTACRGRNQPTNSSRKSKSPTPSYRRKVKYRQKLFENLLRCVL